MLLDARRRADYDATLVARPPSTPAAPRAPAAAPTPTATPTSAPREIVPEPADPVRRRRLLLFAAAAAITAGIAYLATRKRAGPPKVPKGMAAPRPLETLRAEAGASLARASRRDISGRLQDLGVAFAVAPGRVVARCGASPGAAQYALQRSGEPVAAALAQGEIATGYCLLEASWARAPLALSAVPLRVGAPVFALLPQGVGDVALVNGKVAALEAGAPIGLAFAAPLPDGTPIVDAGGKVVAIAEGTAQGMVLARPAREVMAP